MFSPKIDGATTIKSQADAAAVYNRKKLADDLIGDSRKNYRDAFNNSRTAKTTKKNLEAERDALVAERDVVRKESASSEVAKTRKANRLRDLDSKISKKDRQIEAQQKIIDDNSENARQYSDWQREVKANKADLEVSPS